MKLFTVFLFILLAIFIIWFIVRMYFVDVVMVRHCMEIFILLYLFIEPNQLFIFSGMEYSCVLVRIFERIGEYSWISRAQSQDVPHSNIPSPSLNIPRVSEISLSGWLPHHAHV